MSGTSLRIALAGDGEGASCWAAALSEIASVVPVPEDLSQDIDAVAVVPGVSDPFARAKEALVAGVPVLYAAPFLLSPWQASRLQELSSSRRRLLRFVEPFQYRPGFPFLRRLLRGREPFWRPLYVRVLRLERPDAGSRIDELAAEELAVCDALLEREALRVTAAAGRADLVGDVDAAFLTIEYVGGLVVQCTMSLAESPEARQLVVATPGRTVVMDDLDPVASLRIVGQGENEITDSPSIEGQRMVAGPNVDPSAEEARRFVRAVVEGDLSLSNGERWTRVAGVWWAARQSMSFGGAVELPVGREEAEPPLRVIEGGGRYVPTAGPRPSLTVVNS